MEKRKKGRLEKKHWDQLVVICPSLRGLVSRYEAQFGLVENEIERCLQEIETYFLAPLRCGDALVIAKTAIRHFLAAAAERHFPHADPLEARAYILSRVATDSLIVILKKGAEDGSQ